MPVQCKYKILTQQSSRLDGNVVKITITGPPQSGKKSLLNLLASLLRLMGYDVETDEYD